MDTARLDAEEVVEQRDHEVVVQVRQHQPVFPWEVVLHQRSQVAEAALVRG